MLWLIVVLPIAAAITWGIFDFFMDGSDYYEYFLKIAIVFAVVSVILSVISLVLFYCDPELSGLTVFNRVLITIIMLLTWLICATIGWTDILGIIMIFVNIVLILVWLISHCVNSCVVSNEFEEQKTSTTPIECIADNWTVEGKISGSYLYIGGNIDGKGIYTFYTKGEDGSFSQVNIPTEGTKVFYTEDGETPHYDIVEKMWYSYNYNYEPAIRSEEPCYTEETYEIYVPSGTISNSYSLDASF